MSEKPWQLNSDLQEEHIVKVTHEIIRVRGEVIDRHDNELGDTNLSLGVRCYECCRTNLISCANKKKWPWFGILTKNGRFTFKIGETPVRFVRNDPKQLPSEKLIRSEECEIQLDLFPQPVNGSNLIWYIVIDTFYTSVADNVYFVGYNNLGKIICQWEIPLELESKALRPVSDLRPDSRQLDRAPIGLKKPNLTASESDE